MQKRMIRIVSFVVVLAFLLAGVVHAAYVPGDEINATPRPKMTIIGSTATCSVRLTASGQTIDATLELTQGSTVIASWSDTGTGVLTLSGTATVVSGLTYTLTVSGTINNVPFTPASITVTP